MPISGTNEAPTFLSTLNNVLTYVAGGPPTALDSSVDVYDLELSERGNYGGASVTIEREAGANSEDIFLGVGRLVIGAQGGDVTLGGTAVGTVTANSGGILTITFNENADQAAVNETLSSIGYGNVTAEQSVSANFAWTFSDGNDDDSQGSGGAQSATGTTTVDIVKTADAVKTIQYIDFRVAIPAGGTAPVLSVALDLSSEFDEVQASYYLWTESGGLGSQQTFALTYNPETGYYEGSKTLSRYAASGNYRLSFVHLTDSNGTIMVSYGEMDTKGFDVEVPFVNPHPDTTMPVLKSATFGDFYQGEDGCWYLPFEVEASDSGSGLSLEDLWADIILPTGGMPKANIAFDENGHAEGEFKLNHYTPSGTYTFQSVRIEDQAGNGTYSKQFFINHPVTATLDNPDSDSVKATLSEFSMTAVLDEATDRPRIIVEGYGDDALSGMESVFLRLNGPAGTNASYLLGDYDNLQNDDLDMHFDGYIGLTSDYFCGTYTVDLLRLMDRAQNESDYSAAKLKALGLAGSVNVYFPNKPGVTTVNGSGGNDYVFGTNAGSETLYAAGGNDIVIAGDGNDLIIGGDGAGNDTYYGGNGVDTVKYTSALAGITVDLSAGSAKSTGGKNAAGIGTDVLSGIENVIAGNYGDVIIGDEAANAINGAAGNDNLSGGDGDDTLIGGAGRDTMSGGVGDDTYTVDASNDMVIEDDDGGVDLVKAAIAVAGTTYTLTANVEKATVTSTVAINLTGNDLDNILTGNAAANTLNGGVGADTLIGGFGSDVYILSDPDTVQEDAGKNTGTDTVKASFSYELGDNVENLTLTGSDAINGNGNGLNNALTGNAVANTLNGFGGNDTLKGGAGNDTIIGGEGDDVMFGGSGDDTYKVDSSGDKVYESTDTTGATDATGVDTVESSVNWTLSAYVENLTLKDGAGSIKGTGNGKANTIIGNEGDNVLSGGAGNDILDGGDGGDTLKGGAGKDILSGGAGDDIFVFNSALSGTTNVDTIVGFTTGSDKIQLENAIFTKLAVTDALNVKWFHSGDADHWRAADANDYILYDTSTGCLYYDANGNAAGGVVKIAELGSASLAASDIVVI